MSPAGREIIPTACEPLPESCDLCPTAWKRGAGKERRKKGREEGRKKGSNDEGTGQSGGDSQTNTPKGGCDFEKLQGMQIYIYKADQLRNLSYDLKNTLSKIW